MRRLSPLVLLLAVLSLAPIAAQPGLRDAIRSYRQEAARNPTDPEVLTDLANLLVLTGGTVEAEEIYRRVLELDESRVNARYDLALLLHQTGRHRPARREQLKVLELEPDHAWAHYQLGTLAAEAGERAKAIKYYSRAFTLEHRLTQASFNPHVLDNKLAIEAVMKAHSAPSSAALAPRHYEQPRRIAKLLLRPPPEIEPVGEEGRLAEEPPEAQPGGGELPSMTRHRAGAPGPARATVGRERTGRAVEPTEPVEQGASSRDRSRRESGRRIQAPSTTIGRSGSVIGPPPAGQQRGTAPRSGADGELSSEESTGRTQGRSEGRETRPAPFRPGEASTGRLELRLVPAEEDTLAANG